MYNNLLRKVNLVPLAFSGSVIGSLETCFVRCVFMFSLVHFCKTCQILFRCFFSNFLFFYIWKYLVSPRNLLGSPESNNILLLLILCIYKYMHPIPGPSLLRWFEVVGPIAFVPRKQVQFLWKHIFKGSQLLTAYDRMGMGLAAITVSGPIVSCKLDTHIAHITIA